jgi:hypothetical protein
MSAKSVKDSLAKFPFVEFKQVYTSDMKSLQKINLGGFDVRTGKIHIKVFAVDSILQAKGAGASPGSPISNIYKEVLELIDANNALLSAVFIHEYKHLLNSSINMRGLSVDELSDAVFYDEVSARLFELMYYREKFIQTRNADETFAPVMFRDTDYSKINHDGYGEQLSFLTKALERYYTYLKNSSPKGEASAKELSRILEYCAEDIGSTKTKRRLYGKTMPWLVEAKAFNTHVDWLRGGGGQSVEGNESAAVEIATIESVCRAMFGEYYEEFGGMSEIAKCRKYFEIVRKENVYTRKMNQVHDSYDQILMDIKMKSMGK